MAQVLINNAHRLVLFPQPPPKKILIIPHYQFPSETRISIRLVETRNRSSTQILRFLNIQTKCVISGAIYASMAVYPQHGELFTYE